MTLKYSHRVGVVMAMIEDNFQDIVENGPEKYRGIKRPLMNGFTI